MLPGHIREVVPLGQDGADNGRAHVEAVVGVGRVLQPLEQGFLEVNGDLVGEREGNKNSYLNKKALHLQLKKKTGRTE